MGALVFLLPLLANGAMPAEARDPDLVLHHGKIVTVDPQFGVAKAMAVKAGRIVAVGGNDDVLRLAGPKTDRLDLKGQVVLPGLIDSHSHPPDAAMYEFDHPVPAMETVADVLAYVRSRAKALRPGQWIGIQQVFITRLRDQRFPTRRELDEAAPDNPVFFRTGPDAALSTLALRLSGIDKDLKIADAPFLPICRSQIDVAYKCPDARIAGNMPGFHWITIYGDYIREAGYGLKKIPIAFENLG
jgi:hypothetical protein